MATENLIIRCEPSALMHRLLKQNDKLGNKDPNTYCPNAPMTRAEYVAVYNRINGRDGRYDITTDVKGNSVKCNFKDLSPSQ